MPKGPQQPLRAEGNSSWLEKCRERDRKKTEIFLFRWNPLLYPLMVCPTMISSLLHKRAWRLVPQGGEPKSLSAITRMHKIVCVCARCWTTASAVSVSVTSAGALPCTSTHSLPETAAEPRCITLCSTRACFKWHSVVLGFGWSEEQSGPLCHLSSQCAVSGLGQTEYKVPVRWWNRHFTRRQPQEGERKKTWNAAFRADKGKLVELMYDCIHTAWAGVCTHIHSWLLKCGLEIPHSAH